MIEDDEVTVEERLIAALRRQEALVPMVAKLSSRSRKQTIALGVLTFLFVAVAILGANAWVVARDFRQASERADRDRAASLLQGCRIRNGANAVTREFPNHFYDALATLFPSDAGKQFVANLRAAAPIPTPSDQDVDCDGNGGLDSGDYPATGGP